MIFYWHWYFMRYWITLSHKIILSRFQIIMITFFLFVITYLPCRVWNRFSNVVFLMCIMDHYIIISPWILTINTVYSIICHFTKNKASVRKVGSYMAWNILFLLDWINQHISITCQIQKMRVRKPLIIDFWKFIDALGLASGGQKKS